VVKLARVLLLGPVVLCLSIGYRSSGRKGPWAIFRLVPWFVIGFLGLAAARSSGALPDGVAVLLRSVSGALMVASMAALGLGVDARSVRRVGLQVGAVVIASLLLLLVISLVLIRGLGLGAEG
jgi:uncharacterized membrane protein YadS